MERKFIHPEYATLLLALLIAVASTTIALHISSVRAGAVDVPVPNDPVETACEVTEAPTVSPAPSYYVPNYDTADMVILAKALYGEARGVQSKAKQAAVVWCILNRVDDERWPNTIQEVCVTSQFNGYDPDNPLDLDMYELAFDVYSRWEQEHNGVQDVGRTLPREYVFFHGDGTENWFRTEYEHTGEYWDWSLPSPYEE